MVFELAVGFAMSRKVSVVVAHPQQLSSTFLVGAGMLPAQADMKVTANIIGLIKHEMTRRKWETPADLARVCGIDRSTAWSILNGRRKTIDDDTVTKLCVALGLSEADLVTKASGVVKESRATYTTRDPLIVFIERDIGANPDHRPAYEGVAVVFGYQKGKRP